MRTYSTDAGFAVLTLASYAFVVYRWRMPGKREHQINIHLDDGEKARVAEYIAWAQANHIEMNEAEATRSLMQRGYLAWKAQSPPKRRGKVL